MYDILLTCKPEELLHYTEQLSVTLKSEEEAENLFVFYLKEFLN